MAFNTTNSIELNNTTYIHDFLSGPFSVVANLTLGHEFFTPTGGGIQLPIANTMYFGNPAPNGSVTNPTQGYGILADHGTSGLGLIANITNLYGNTLTKINWPQSGVNSAYIGNLAGPYTFTYNTAGAKTARFILYRRTGFAWAPGQALNFIPGLPYPQVTAAGDKTFSFNIYQASVAVVRRDSNVGPILQNGSSIGDMDTITNNTIVLNKSDNRGDDVSSTWAILKQDGNGVYQTAINGTDYSIIGILTDDEITITWLTSGSYRVRDSIVGLGANNDDQSSVDFSVGQSITNTITLPLVKAVVTPDVAYNNTVLNVNPLTGVTNFKFTVSSVLDTNNASWLQTVDFNPSTTITMTDATWRTEILHRCNVICRVRKGNVIVESRTGFGPHQFILDVGNYTAGYELTPKVYELTLNTEPPVVK